MIDSNIYPICSVMRLILPACLTLFTVYSASEGVWLHFARRGAGVGVGKLDARRMGRRKGETFWVCIHSHFWAKFR